MNEKRFFEATEFRVETMPDGKIRLSGHAAVFNSPSKPLKTGSGKMFIEKVAPGAFKRSLESNKDIAMFDDHEPRRILARTSGGTLNLSEDSTGLRFDASLTDTTAATDLVKNINHKNVRGVSFGFSNPKDEWSKDGDTNLRTLHDVDLGEISPTPFPAYDRTTIDVRAIDQAIEQLENRQVGFGMNTNPQRSYDPAGQYTDRDVQRMCDNLRSSCRSMHDAVHDTHELLRSVTPTKSTLSAQTLRTIGFMGREARALRGRLGELGQHVRHYLLSDEEDPSDPDREGGSGDHDQDDPGADQNTPDNPPPLHDRDPGAGAARMMYLAQKLERASTLAERQAIRALMAQENRGGESVNSGTAARARRSIVSGNVDTGTWDAPNQGDRKQADCLGSDLSYPIFKGGKLSIPGLRAAASRGAQHAPSVGKAASALLELYNKKKDGRAIFYEDGTLEIREVVTPPRVIVVKKGGDGFHTYAQDGSHIGGPYDSEEEAIKQAAGNQEIYSSQGSGAQTLAPGPGDGVSKTLANPKQSDADFGTVASGGITTGGGQTVKLSAPAGPSTGPSTTNVVGGNADFGTTSANKPGSGGGQKIWPDDGKKGAPTKKDTGKQGGGDFGTK